MSRHERFWSSPGWGEADDTTIKLVFRQVLKGGGSKTLRRSVERHGRTCRVCNPIYRRENARLQKRRTRKGDGA